MTAGAVTRGCHTISCFLISDATRACSRPPVVKNQLPASVQRSRQVNTAAGREKAREEEVREESRLVFETLA